MIGGAMRRVGEEQVRQIYEAMPGKHPGDFWKAYRYVKQSSYGSKPGQRTLPSEVIQRRFFGEDI